MVLCIYAQNDLLPKRKDENSQIYFDFQVLLSFWVFKKKKKKKKELNVFMEIY